VEDAWDIHAEPCRRSVVPRSPTTNAAPVFSQQGGRVPRGFNLTMTATNTIYYTLDGSMPQPGDTSGAGSTQAYTASFSVASGTVIRCLAWNSAILPSDVDQSTINY